MIFVSEGRGCGYEVDGRKKSFRQIEGRLTQEMYMEVGVTFENSIYTD